MRQDGYPLLRKSDVLDVSKVFLGAFLYSSQQEKTVSVRSEDWMWLYVQPLAFRGTLRVGLLAVPARRPTGRHYREILRAGHPDHCHLGRILAYPAGRDQVVLPDAKKKQTIFIILYFEDERTIRRAVLPLK